MAVELTGTIKYARHMKGENGGKEYDFFSFVVLDNDEGVRWPLQVQGDHPQFADLCQHEKEYDGSPGARDHSRFFGGLSQGD